MLGGGGGAQLYGFICFGAEAHHLPLIAAIVVLVNGGCSEVLTTVVVAKNAYDHSVHHTLTQYLCVSAGLLAFLEKKNFNHVILWNTLIDSKKGVTVPLVATDPKNRLCDTSKRREFVLEVCEGGGRWRVKIFCMWVWVYVP